MRLVSIARRLVQRKLDENALIASFAKKTHLTHGGISDLCSLPGTFNRLIYAYPYFFFVFVFALVLLVFLTFFLTCLGAVENSL